MAKLMLSFKDRRLKVFGLPAGDCLIGRDSDCNVHIDSLAVEPRHARVRQVGESFVVEALDSNALILVNGKVLTGLHELNEGDQFQIGKHTLSFSAEGEGTSLSPNVTHLPGNAWLQIHSGSHLGRAMRLDKAFTRIGKPDGNLAVIAHRGDGYYLSHLQGDTGPQVNDRDIGEKVTLLKDNDIVSVGDLTVQFFSDQASDSAAPAPDQVNREQRRFTRIPFAVPVTLRSGQQTWDTALVDISLHGALIKVPTALQASMEQQYKLSIHLDGEGPVCMDVMVAHQQDDKLGLRCVDIDLDSITRLRTLVELTLGEAELLERELSALG